MRGCRLWFVKILIVDDHPLVRDAMSRIVVELAPAVEVLQAADCARGLELARNVPDIDLILLDLNLPGVRGFEALEQFRREHPALPVVVVSMHHDGDTVREVIRRGALGFIPKVCTKETILGALRLVLSGTVYVPSQAMAVDTDMGDAAQMQSPGRAAVSLSKLGELGLTPRQGEVLALMMRGRNNKEICRDLGLAQRTVKLHVSAVLNTLRVSSRTQAVIVAAHLGLTAENIARGVGGR